MAILNGAHNAVRVHQPGDQLSPTTIHVERMRRQQGQAMPSSFLDLRHPAPAPPPADADDLRILDSAGALDTDDARHLKSRRVILADFRLLHRSPRGRISHIGSLQRPTPIYCTHST